MAHLTFLGAARTVTGSKYLLEHDGRRVLFDCGLFQGLKELRQRNWEPFPAPPQAFDAVVLTHAHLDHVGYLPRLCAQGFQGKVFCTPGTADLCGLVRVESTYGDRDHARDDNAESLAEVIRDTGPMDALRALVTDRFNWQPYMPVHGERIDV